MMDAVAAIHINENEKVLSEFQMKRKLIKSIDEQRQFTGSEEDTGTYKYRDDVTSATRSPTAKRIINASINPNSRYTSRRRNHQQEDGSRPTTSASY